MGKNNITIVLGSAPNPDFSSIKVEDVNRIICSNYSAFNLPSELRTKLIEVFFGGNAVNDTHANKLSFYKDLEIKKVTILDHKSHFGLSFKGRLTRSFTGLKKIIFGSKELERTLTLLKGSLKANTVRFIDRFLYFRLHKYIIGKRLLRLTYRKYPSTGVFSVFDTVLRQKNATIVMVGFTLSYAHAYENNDKSKNTAHYQTDIEILKCLVKRKSKLYTTSEILNKTAGVPLWKP